MKDAVITLVLVFCVPMIIISTFINVERRNFKEFLVINNKAKYVYWDGEKQFKLNKNEFTNGCPNWLTH